MDILKAAVISICFTAIAVGIIEMLLPGGSFKPQMRLLTGAVLIISLIVPLFSLSNVKLPQFDEQSVTVDISQTLEKAAAASAKTEITDILKKNNITTAKITVFTDRNADNCIDIIKAVIAVDKSDIDKASAAANEIKQQLKIKAEVEEA